MDNIDKNLKESKKEVKRAKRILKSFEKNKLSNN